MMDEFEQFHRTRLANREIYRESFDRVYLLKALKYHRTDMVFDFLKDAADYILNKGYILAEYDFEFLSRIRSGKLRNPFSYIEDILEQRIKFLSYVLEILFRIARGLDKNGKEYVACKFMNTLI